MEEGREKDFRAACTHVRAFLKDCRRRKPPITEERLKQTLGYRYKVFEAYLDSPTLPNEPVPSNIIRLARELEQSTHAVWERLLGEPQSPQPSESAEAFGRQLLADALERTGSETPEDAVVLAKRGFEILSGIDVQAALELLPRLLYIANRYGTVAQIGGAVRLAHRVISDQRKMLVLPESVIVATRVQLAFALNEGGAPRRRAADLFANPVYRQVQHLPSDYAWLNTTYLRNKAHFFAWNTKDPDASEAPIIRASELDRTSGNVMSCANTGCETRLACGAYESAFEPIRTECLRITNHLRVHFHAKQQRFIGAPLERFHHAYAAYFLAVLARSLGDASYADENLEYDLQQLEALLLIDGNGSFRREIRIGHRLLAIKKDQVRARPPELAIRLRRIEQASTKHLLREGDVAAIVELLPLLQG